MGDILYFVSFAVLKIELEESRRESKILSFETRGQDSVVKGDT